jgi:choline dehydrogenase
MDEFDYVVCGAGMAGCVVAYRLCEAGYSVAVIEAGPADRNPFIHIPGGFIKTMFNPKLTWPFETAPQAALGNRKIRLVQGRVAGGSSSINGFNYTRGQAEDFDEWSSLGNPGWSYEDVLPYFRKSESYAGELTDFRGSDGPLPITPCSWVNPLCEAFLEAAAQAGIAPNPDYNGKSQSGSGYQQRWISGGLRISTAKAFLRPALKTGRVKLITNATVSRVKLDGATATGVTYRPAPSGPERHIEARREVVLCAGSVNSPKLLQLSGIGSHPHLRSTGITPTQDLPGVGEGLQDHYVVRVVTKVDSDQTINRLSHGLPLLGEILRWATGRPSILAISPSVACAFWNSQTDGGRPNVQLLFGPGSFMRSVPGLLDDFAGVTLGFIQQRPESRGHVRISSSDPFCAPEIDPRYLAEEADQKTVVSGLRLVRRVMASPAFQRYSLGEVSPGREVESDEDLLRFAQSNGTTGFHPTGTCRMGPDTDPLSVVDAQLKVRNVHRLRVIDASIMPKITSGNTGAPTLMIAEKGSAMMIGDAKS